VDLALHFSGTVLSCAGAPGKVLVPGGGNDDLLSSAEPAVDTPVQSEELEVRMSLLCLHDALNQMSDKKIIMGVSGFCAPNISICAKPRALLVTELCWFLGY